MVLTMKSTAAAVPILRSSGQAYVWPSRDWPSRDWLSGEAFSLGCGCWSETDMMATSCDEL